MHWADFLTGGGGAAAVIAVAAPVVKRLLKAIAKDAVREVLAEAQHDLAAVEKPKVSPS